MAGPGTGGDLGVGDFDLVRRPGSLPVEAVLILVAPLVTTELMTVPRSEPQ